MLPNHLAFCAVIESAIFFLAELCFNCFVSMQDLLIVSTTDLYIKHYQHISVRYIWHISEHNIPYLG